MIRMHPKISVIIPIYNVEPYLRRCLDSVVNQTLRDIEIICVNDCSQDNSLEILRKYETSDKRVKVIDFPENRGVSVARNAGIKAAQGEYIGFIDSDDYINTIYYEKLFEAITKKCLDVVFTKLCFIFDDKKSGRNSDHQWFINALWRRDFILNNNILFPPGMIRSQDGVFMFRALMCLPKVNNISDACYYYSQNPGSVTRNNNIEKELSTLSCYDIIFSELLEKGKTGILTNEQIAVLFGKFFNSFYWQISTRTLLTLPLAAEKAIFFYSCFRSIPGVEEILRAINSDLYRLLHAEAKDDLAVFLGNVLKRNIAAEMRKKIKNPLSFS